MKGSPPPVHSLGYRQVGMRMKRGNRVEIRDSTNRILRYEDEE